MKRSFSLLLALFLALSPLPAVSADAPRELSGEAEAAYIQKYGNVPLSLTCEELLGAGYAYGDLLTVRFLEQELILPLCSNYSDVDSGSPAVFARPGDTQVVLAVNMGDFASTYGIAFKTTYPDKSFSWSYAEGVTGPVAFTLSLYAAGAYYDEYLMHQLSYTNEREDYLQLSDEEYANFRAVGTTGMGKNVLYRAASPVNPEKGRSAFADAAFRQAGVTVVMNLADDGDMVRGYPGYRESYYASTRYIALNMGVDFAAADFQAKLADGLRFFAENPGVYAVHCTEGKDRAGFVIALLECLMGASEDEVIADYMISYYNYYGVTKEDARYGRIAESNIVKSLQRAFGVTDLASADLSACAAEYMRSIGLREEELSALKANLSAAPGEREEGRSCTVVAGDCLWNLAYRYYGTGRAFGRIAEANGISSPYLIYVGQTLYIPA